MKQNSNTDCYFTKTAQTAIDSGIDPVVEYQVFQKFSAIMCGSGYLERLFADMNVGLALVPDGKPINPWEAVMRLTGRLSDIAQLETIYLGYLARMTRIATNVRNVVDAAGKPVLFFPARFEVPETQFYDGWAAYVGGAAGCSTAGQMAGFAAAKSFIKRTWVTAADLTPIGTMPHALIAAFGGDTAAATVAFAKTHPKEDTWALVDFHNTCAKTALECAKAMKEAGYNLTGVRLDTSEKLIDEGITQVTTNRGVCPELVHHVRNVLDSAGFKNVKIGVSGGFTATKITLFEGYKVPVDVYAVGESFLKGANPFTSDIVAIKNHDGEWMESHKVGRGRMPSSEHLVTVKNFTDTKAAAPR